MLYIGGVGVARGYLNRPSLTAQYFIASPFGSGERLYRTGDRVRYLPGLEGESCSRYTHDPLLTHGIPQLLIAHREYLKTQLLEHMIPDTLVILRELPLSPNGKVDRRRLPGDAHRSLDSPFRAPRTPTEAALQEIWAEMFKLDRVGMATRCWPPGLSHTSASCSRWICPCGSFSHFQTIAGLARCIVEATVGLGPEQSLEERLIQMTPRAGSLQPTFH